MSSHEGSLLKFSQLKRGEYTNQHETENGKLITHCVTVPRSCIGPWSQESLVTFPVDEETLGRSNVTKITLALADHRWSIYVAETPEEVEAIYQGKPC